MKTLPSIILYSVFLQVCQLSRRMSRHLLPLFNHISCFRRYEVELCWLLVSISQLVQLPQGDHSLIKEWVRLKLCVFFKAHSCASHSFPFMRQQRLCPSHAVPMGSAPTSG